MLFTILICSSVTDTHTRGGIAGGMPHMEAASAQEALQKASRVLATKGFEIGRERPGRIDVREVASGRDGWISCSMPRPRDT